MTTTSKYSTDVETMTINDGANSWDRVRTNVELKSFVERHLSLVGELDPLEYEVAA